MTSSFEHPDWFKVEHKVDDEDLLRDAVSDVMGSCHAGVDIWVVPDGKRLPEWWLGSVGIPDRDEPALDDIDLDVGPLRAGDLVIFFFEQADEGAHFLAQWR